MLVIGRVRWEQLEKGKLVFYWEGFEEYVKGLFSDFINYDWFGLLLRWVRF